MTPPSVILIPFELNDKVSLSRSIATVAAPDPSKVKSAIPFPSVKVLVVVPIVVLVNAFVPRVLPLTTPLESIIKDLFSEVSGNPTRVKSFASSLLALIVFEEVILAPVNILVPARCS